MSAVIGRINRSRNRTISISSFHGDDEIQLVGVLIASPTTETRHQRRRPSLGISIRGRQFQGRRQRPTRIPASFLVVPPGEPATPAPNVLNSQRSLPRYQREVPRSSFRSERRRYSPPSPSVPSHAVIRQVNRASPIDLPRPTTPPLVNQVVPPVNGVFECAICMERLSCPATIIENNDNQPNAANNPGEQGEDPGLGVLEIIDDIEYRVFYNPNIPRPRRRIAVNLADVNPKEIMATPCGHMYHHYCIQKWFNEQG